MSSSKVLSLNNGKKMPIIGLGTCNKKKKEYNIFIIYLFIIH